MPVRIILIETSTSLCSAALLEGDVITARRHSDTPRAHASMTAPFVQQILDERGLKVSDCDAVCLSMGPGSYTGLRVGSSTAKGLCFGAGIPLLAVGTLDVLAAQAIEAGLPQGCTHIVPMIDARRMEVYSAIYSVEGHRLTEVRPIVVDSFDSLGLTCDLRNGFPLSPIKLETGRSGGSVSPGLQSNRRSVSYTDGQTLESDCSSLPSNREKQVAPADLSLSFREAGGTCFGEQTANESNGIRQEAIAAADLSLNYREAAATASCNPAVGGILFIGDGVQKCEGVLAGEGRWFRQECPTAEAMKKPALRELEAGHFRDTAYFEPFYLKEFVATVGKKPF